MPSETALIPELLPITKDRIANIARTDRVARAEFGWPCIPYEYANIEKPGFYSGIIAPQVISNDVSTTPIFSHTSIVSHPPPPSSR